MTDKKRAIKAERAKRELWNLGRPTHLQATTNKKKMVRQAKAFMALRFMARNERTTNG